jgi:hypothetical protein
VHDVWDSMVSGSVVVWISVSVNDFVIPHCSTQFSPDQRSEMIRNVPSGVPQLVTRGAPDVSSETDLDVDQKSQMIRDVPRDDFRLVIRDCPHS